MISRTPTAQPARACRPLVRSAGAALLIPAKFLAVLIANLLQLLMIALLLLLAAALAGWKLVSMRRASVPGRSAALERSPASGRQR